VRAIAATSAAVSALLSEILADEEEEELSYQPVTVSGSLPGLDVRHFAVVRGLAEKERWTRAEWDALCGRLGVLPEGALEAINEAAYAEFGATLLDGEEELEVNKELVQKVIA